MWRPGITMSGVPGKLFTWVLYVRPSALRARLTVSSGAVSQWRTRDMRKCVAVETVSRTNQRLSLTWRGPAGAVLTAWPALHGA